MLPQLRADLLIAAFATTLLTAPLEGSAQPDVPVRGTDADSIAALIEWVRPAVVFIDVRTPSDSSRYGSGILIGPSGLIVTADHLVRDARGARVTLASGDVYDQVTVLAEDERREIAILRVPGFGLPVVQFGDSDALEIGAPVVVVDRPQSSAAPANGSIDGSPGVLAALPPSDGLPGEDAAAHFRIAGPPLESSGGAVLSLDGRVVGIAVAKGPGDGDFVSVVPIEHARDLADRLAEAPVVRLGPMVDPTEEILVEPPARADVVNEGLTFALDNLSGYVIESTTRFGEQELRRTRITYRLIESVDGTPLRVERFLVSETTGSVEPHGSSSTIRRVRVRSVANLDGLSPVSSNGEIRWWNGHGWETAEHSVRFEENRVTGIVRDTTGRGLELDRALPRGVVLSDLRELAFAIVDAEPLLGRSVELTTFDPWTGEMTEYRYDVLGEETIDVAGAPRDVLRVDIAFALTNETIFFERERPRLPVQRISRDGMLIESFDRSLKN